MKFVLLVALSALAVSNAFVLTPLGEDHEEWENFKTKFERKYLTAEEELKRKLIFKDNLDFIRAHNKKFENHEETFAVAVNHFADMTNDEFRAKLNRINPAPKQRSTKVYKKPNNSTPEASVDWRDKGAVTAVKNQGDCLAAGYAFSAAASIESQNFIKTGSLISLSEQNIMACSGNYGNVWCDQGRVDWGFQYVIDNGGIDTEESYPYVGDYSGCNYSDTNIGATISSFVDVGESEDDLQSAVSSVGPISVAIDASELAFQFYFGGVYRGWMCGSHFHNMNHNMLVVGYGTKTGLFSGGDYWIVKNSFGTSWGIDGYILMSRNKNNNCGIASLASYPVV